MVSKIFHSVSGFEGFEWYRKSSQGIFFYIPMSIYLFSKHTWKNSAKPSSDVDFEM
jgi:hypothetical protein